MSDQHNRRHSANYHPQHQSAYPSLQYPPGYPVRQYSAQQSSAHLYSSQQPGTHQYTAQQSSAQQPASHQYTVQQSSARPCTTQQPATHQYTVQQSSAHPYTVHQYSAQHPSALLYISQQPATHQYTAQQLSVHPYRSQPLANQSQINIQEASFNPDLQVKTEPFDTYEPDCEQGNRREIVSSEFPEYLSHTVQRDNIEEARNNNLSPSSFFSPSSYQGGVTYLYNDPSTTNILEPQIELEIGPGQYQSRQQRRRRETPEIIDLVDSPSPLGESAPDESHVVENASPFPSFVSNKTVLKNYISNMMKHSESEANGTCQPTIVTLKPVLEGAEGDLENDDEIFSGGGGEAQEVVVGIQSSTQVDFNDSLNNETINNPDSSNCETNLFHQGIENLLVGKMVHENRTQDCTDLPSQDMIIDLCSDNTGTNCLELGTDENRESPDTAVHTEPMVLSSLSSKNGSISVSMELPSLEETSKYSHLKELLVSEGESLAFCEKDDLTSQMGIPRDNFSPPSDTMDSVPSVTTKPPEDIFSEEFSKPRKTYSRIKEAQKSSTDTETRESRITDDCDGPPVLLPEVSLASSSNEEVIVAETLVRLGNQTELSLRENGIESLQSFSDSFLYTSSLGDLTKESKQSSRDTSNQGSSKETVDKDPSFEEDFNMFFNETVSDKDTSIDKRKLADELTSQILSKEVEINLTNSKQQQTTQSSLNEIDKTQTGEATPIKDNQNFANTENLHQMTSNENNKCSKRYASPDSTLTSKRAKKNKKGKKGKHPHGLKKKKREKDKSKDKEVNGNSSTRVTRSSSLRAQDTSEDVTITPHGIEKDGIYLLHPRPNRKGYLFCPQKPIISCLLPESMVVTLREKSDGKKGTSQTNPAVGSNNKSIAQIKDLDGKLSEKVSLSFKGVSNSLRTSGFKIGYLEIKGYEELGYNIQRKGSTFSCPNFDFTSDQVSNQQAEHLLKTAEFSKPPSKVSPPGQKDQSHLPSEMQDTKHYITYFWAAKSVEFGEDVSSAVLPSDGPFTNFIGISDLPVMDIMRVIIMKNSHAFASSGTASEDSMAATVPLRSEKDGERIQPGSLPPEVGKERECSHRGSNQRRDPGRSVGNTQQHHSEVTGPNAGYNSRDINYMSNAAQPHVPPISHYEAPYHIPQLISPPSDHVVINNNPPVHRAPLYSSKVHHHGFSNTSSNYLPPADNVPGNGYNPHVPQGHSFSNVSPQNFPNSSSNYIPSIIANNAPDEGNDLHAHYGQMFSSSVIPHNFPNPSSNHLPPISSDNVPNHGNNSYDQRGQFSSKVLPQQLHNTSGDFIPPEPAPLNYSSPRAQGARGSNNNQPPNVNPVYHNLSTPHRQANMYRQSAPRQQNPQRYPNPRVHPSYQPKDFHMNAPGCSYNTNNPEIQREQYQEPSNEFSQQLHNSPTVSPRGGVPARRNHGASNEFEQPSTSTPPNYSLGVPREQRLTNYDLTVNQRNIYRPYTTTASSIPYRVLLSTSGGNMIRGPSPYGIPSNYELSPSGFSRMTSDTLGLRPQGEPYGPTPPATLPNSPFVDPPDEVESADALLHAEVEDAVVNKDAGRLRLLITRAQAIGDGVSARRAEVHLAFLRRDLTAAETLIAAEAFPECYLKEMLTLWFSCRFMREYPNRALPKTFAVTFRQRHNLPETLHLIVYRIMAAAFAENPFPLPEERLLLAERVGLTTKQVDIWFKNHRKNLKHQETKEPSSGRGGRKGGRGRGRGRKS